MSTTINHADYNEIDAGWKNKDMDTKARDLCQKSKPTQCAPKDATCKACAKCDCPNCTCADCKCPPKSTKPDTTPLVGVCDCTPTNCCSAQDYAEIDAGWIDDEMDTKARNQCPKRKDRTDLGCHDCSS